MLLLFFLACRLPAFGGCFRSAIGLSSKYMFSVDSWFEGFICVCTCLNYIWLLDCLFADFLIGICKP
ncbi:hypothetical protein HanXRQr2_Chr02g0059061 [Helianthus annuus]|uniref:Secreted protein n=1 Tax=Helianthus annuus TaxID=4232 RepID=A0A9K3JMR1_HELAN|nr:hypothetical protein HanXRQr2_Chr02g0059061 [Helianthus annuus]KAJ0618368.1 hypothetical protein HanHA89_Chr02g0052431 [Helianthus annuus]